MTPFSTGCVSSSARRSAAASSPTITSLSSASPMASSSARSMGRPTIEGNVTRGRLSAAQPALMKPEPLSTTMTSAAARVAMPCAPRMSSARATCGGARPTARFDGPSRRACNAAYKAADR